jgi:hypothetical protein
MRTLYEEPVLPSSIFDLNPSIGREKELIF